MAIKCEIMQQNVLLEKFICKNSPFLPVVRVSCIQFIPIKSVPREGIKLHRELQVAGTIPHTPKDSGRPICCCQQFYTLLCPPSVTFSVKPIFLSLALSLPSHPSVILPSTFDLPLYRNVTSVICYVSTSTSTCPASSYDDICIAVWLESIECSK